MFSSRSMSQSNASFMSRVYAWMMLGLSLSGLIAYQLSSSPALINKLVSNQFLWIGLIVLQLGAVFCLSALINRMSFVLAMSLYLAYAALSGITFSVIFAAFSAQSIYQAFFITAFAFVGLSTFGFITKRDLGPIGSFCMTGLFGLIGFILITMLFPSLMTNAVNMTINTIAILIFSGLTAYDTQRIKSMNMAGLDTNSVRKNAICGALILYLDFINLFLSILRLSDARR